MSWLNIFGDSKDGVYKSLEIEILIFLSSTHLKGIVHFEINFWYVLAYLKDIQDVGVFFFHSIFNFDIFRSNRSCLSVI